MEDSLNKERPEVRFRAFRAIDEPHSCALFVEGHTNVLTSIGVTKVTSSKIGWTINPAVFVLVVESMDGETIYGGARVEVAGGTEPLPIEQATHNIDPAIHDLVAEYAKDGTGEICGLWNSQELSGYGIGTPLLIRSGIAISAQLGIKSLFALCAPYTVKPVVNCGMVLEESIGNKGTFFYPKLDLIATIMVLKDVVELSGARQDDKEQIVKMRSEPGTLQLHELKKKEIVINFDLTIPHMENWDLSGYINAATQSLNKDKLIKAG